MNMQKLIVRDIPATFEAFRRRIEGEVYSEPDTQMHALITENVFHTVIDQLNFPPNTVVIDVGCGQGVALKQFSQRGLQPIGITLSPEDAEACQQLGFECHVMDQSFMSFDSETADFIWCRHALEHSPYPYLTLLEFNRVLKANGSVYLEMPKPEDPRQHEHNTNHYAIMGQTMWRALFERAGFTTKHFREMAFEARGDSGESWTETYLSFLIQKSRPESFE